MMRHGTEAIYPPSSVRTVHAEGVLSRLLARFMFRSETCEGLPQRGNMVLRHFLAVQRSAIAADLERVTNLIKNTAPP